MSEYYVNKQGDKMLNQPYKDSIMYRDVENCSLSQLRNRLPYAEGAISYWLQNEDEIQVLFFREQAEHIKKRIQGLSKLFNKNKI